MIKCLRKHLEERCKERGYSLDDVMPCVVFQDGDEWTVNTDHPSFPRRVKAASLLAKARSFAVAATKHVTAGMPMASDTEIVRRYEICLRCEHLQNEACNLCGCPVSRVAGYVSKLSWADQECPVGKWGKATPSA